MWEENGDGQRINRDNTDMNVKLKRPDREAITIEGSGNGGFMP